ncbi:MAG: type II secretion system protein GspC [Myxococcota bacterium]
MADPTSPEDRRAAAATRRRALIAMAAISLLGFLLGALVNVGLARVLAVPEDVDVPEFVEASPEDVPGEERRGPAPILDGGEDAGEVADAGDARPSRPRGLSKKAYADVIVRRNIFDSTAVYDPSAGGEQGDGSCKSSGDVRLLATIVAEVPAWSSALISIGGGKEAKAEGYVIGDEIGGEGRITAIDQKKVCTDGGSCICIGGEVAKAGSAATTEGAGEGGVSKTGDNKFQVDQSVIDDAMNNFETLAGQIRVVPHKDSSGNVDGYRLSAIRRGSLFDKLGIKNGDIVHAVNGQPLTSTEGALSTYQTLKNERSFSFELTRRNQRQTLEYEVR